MRRDSGQSGEGLGASSGSREPGLASRPGPSGFDPARGVFAFGDDGWPGLAKLVEECGEVIQVVGKLMMVHGSRAHWSGDLRAMLIDEMADLEAALQFVDDHNFSSIDRQRFADRVEIKKAKFEDWHADMDADPPPAIAMEARQGTDPQGLDGEAATARAAESGIAQPTPSHSPPLSNEDR